MFVYSVRSATIKFIAAMAISVAVLISLVAWIPTYEGEARETSGITYTKIGENSDRLAFISQFGWQVEEEPKTEEVAIPETFDKVYLTYNELQKAQGLDLTKYKGKTVTRYTYKITNYPDYEGAVSISLLVYRDKVVAGDICSADMDGFVHGFAAPKGDAAQSGK